MSPIIFSHISEADKNYSRTYTLPMNLKSELKLPCGMLLLNRIAKSAMSENMAEEGHYPGLHYTNLYRRWAMGGVGLCITGNVMIDHRHLGEPCNVVLENDLHLEHFKSWAQTTEGTAMSLWPQLNHPGKQTPKFLTSEPVAPSAIPLGPKMRAFFAPPRALMEKEIEEIINRFANSAKLAQEAGFQGVQIHGAHGYLVSQFLSPKHNQRQDKWGGPLENRMRFLIEIYKSMRLKVGASFPIGVKINSADFQKGGFSHEDAISVCQKISKLGMDLIEISGGSYEKPVMTGQRQSTLKREAYFLQYASDIKKVIECPLMVTGGFRTQKIMEEVINSGEADLIGLARPLAIEPNLPYRLLSDSDVASKVHPITTGIKFVDGLFPLEITWYTRQLHLMGKNLEPKMNANAWNAIYHTLKEMGVTGLRRASARSN